CLATSRLGADPWPLFIALGVVTVLLIVSALRRDWTPLVPFALVMCAVFTTAWHEAYFQPGDVGVALPLYAVFYIGFLALPFAVPSSLVPAWRGRPAPWLASALAGP